MNTIEEDKRQIAAPLLARCPLGTWIDEGEARRGLSSPNLRIFFATHLGLIERKRRWFNRGWKLRRVG